MSVKAWVATAAKQKMVLQDIDLGPLGTEEVEIADEHCGPCHSDLSVLDNDWGISQYPAVLGHEVCRPGDGFRRSDQGGEGRPAGRRWLDRRELHALSPMPVRRTTPVRRGPADDSRPPRRVRLGRAVPLGVGHPAAGGIELRRGRSPPVRGRHRLPPARPARQADQPRWDRRRRRAGAHSVEKLAWFTRKFRGCSLVAKQAQIALGFGWMPTLRANSFLSQ